jgi:HEAT repeat protein
MPRGLIEALGDEDREVYQSLKHAIPQIGDPALRPLCDVLSGDVDEHRRARAAEVLGNMGAKGEAAVPALVQSMEDSDPAVREWATWAAMSIEKGPELVVPAAVKLLEDENYAVKFGAIRCLERFSRHVPLANSVAPKLEALLKDPNQNVQSFAMMLLARMNSDNKLETPAARGVR